MPGFPAPSRGRNAAATRLAILDAARDRFAREGYDGASLREIASDAGVDAALVSRYFGSKEELFVEVLNCAPDGTDMFEGELSGFGERVAAELLDDPDTRDGIDYLLVMLRSASSPAASGPLRRAMHIHFHGPFAAYLGGPDAEVRARLAGDLIMGVAISRAITPDHDLDEEGRARLRKRLAAVLQAAVDP
ncbi:MULTISPECIES: TetR/AcrR family transcriptional regulator [Phenylobacterium]|uniref:AcrR family transcriptional regulator n=1 Tax=Phenylobacterium koreense TaxID=266125 RepID=A0ABV2EEQ8_9CAUL